MYKVSTLAEEYKKKLITADDAAAMVKPGYRIHFGLGCGSVVDIDEALAKRADELRDVEIVSTVAIRKEPFKVYQATTSNDQVRFASAHFSAFDRQMCKDGRCWYIPMLFNELPYYWKNNECGVDIAMFQVGRHQSGEEDHRRSKRKYADCPRPPDTAQSVRHRLCRRRIQLPYSRTSDKTGLRNR